MKKYILILTFVSACCVNIFAQNNDTYLLDVDTVSFNDSVKINKDFAYNFDYSLLVFPSIENKSLLDSIYKPVLDTVLPEYSKAALLSAITTQVHQSLADAIEDIPDGEWEYDSETSMDIFSQTNNLLTLHYSQGGYSGGAHGWYGESYNVFDLQRNKSISNTNIFKDVNDESFSKILLKYFKKDSNEDQKDCLFSDTIPINNNFFFDKESITFVYNIYEIMPYACGMTTITVPFAEITKYLKPEFTENYLQELKDNKRKNNK
jgi:hypothetical protein